MTDRVTIEDVARHSGVSIATVSRAIRGLPNVAEPTRQRVLEAAEELAYRPDPGAVRLAGGKTNTIAVAVPDLHLWYSGQVMAGVESVTAPEGLDLLVFSIPNASRPAHHMVSVVEKRADGLVVLDVEMTAGECERLAALDIPVAVVGAHAPLFDSVEIDNVRGGVLAAEHLVAIGRSRIAVVTGESGRGSSPAPRDRLAGFRQGLAERGLEPLELGIGAAELSARRGFEAMQQLLARTPRPDAVFALSDEMALGAARAIRDRGLAIPDDIAVMGFDDHDLSWAARLSTIRQAPAELGASATRMLLERMAGVDVPPRHELRVPERVVRWSTDRLAQASHGR